MPTGKAYNRFSEIISRLSEEYNSPNFEPHVTLIGAIAGTEDDLSAKTTQLTSLIKPFGIKLAKVDYFDEYHKALFIKAEETTELIKANETAKEVFNLSPDSEYMPHLSLLYGDFSSETKEKIITNLGREFNIDFEIKSVCLYFTTGKEETWHKIKKFPFE